MGFARRAPPAHHRLFPIAYFLSSSSIRNLLQSDPQIACEHAGDRRCTGCTRLEWLWLFFDKLERIRMKRELFLWAYMIPINQSNGARQLDRGLWVKRRIQVGLPILQPREHFFRRKFSQSQFAVVNKNLIRLIKGG